MTRPSPRFLIIAGVVLALGLLGSLWVLPHLEWKETKVRTGFKGEAREDSYFALRELMRHLGSPLTPVEDPLALDRLPTDGTLFLGALLSEPVARTMEPRLIDWVRRGGHLVMVVPGIHQSDRFTTSVGLKRLGMHRSGPDGGSIELEGTRQRLDLNDCDVFTVRHPLLWGGWVTGYRPYRSATDHDDEEDEDDPDADGMTRRDAATAGTRALALARWRLGQGRVTALCEDSFLVNARIGDPGHAQVAVRLLLDADGGPLFISRRPDAPGLPAWLATHAWAPLGAAAMLLILVLWHAMPRFAPIRPEPPPARPGLRTHLLAVAAFRLRRRQFDALLAGPRDELRRLARHHGREQGMAEAARLAGINMAALNDALDATPTDRADYLRLAALIERARMALRAHRATLPKSTSGHSR